MDVIFTSVEKPFLSFLGGVGGGAARTGLFRRRVMGRAVGARRALHVVRPIGSYTQCMDERDTQLGVCLHACACGATCWRPTAGAPSVKIVMFILYVRMAATLWTPMTQQTGQKAKLKLQAALTPFCPGGLGTVIVVVGFWMVSVFS